MTKPPDSPLRIAIWSAVSSKGQAAEDKSSLPDQEAAGRRFAESIGGHVVAVYTVPGHTRDIIFWSEAEESMPAYRQLRQDVEGGTFDVLYALDTDRLGRDPALCNQVVSLVERSGAEVFLASAPHPIGQSTTAKRYAYAIQSVRAKEDQDLRVHRLMQGIKNRVRRGLPANHWPTGYIPTHDPLTGVSIGAELDPGTAPAIRQATQLFLAGQPYGRIARALNDSPYSPPTAAHWSYSTVYKILHSDFYAGYPEWGEVRAPEPSPHYPHLWDPDTHAAVIRERNRRRYARHQRTDGSPLQGVIFCARCGYAMTRHRNRSGTYSVRCSKQTRGSTTGEYCHRNNLPEQDALAAIFRFFADIDIDNPAALAAVSQQIDNTDHLPQRIADLDRRLDDLDTRRERLALALAAGQMDIHIYRTADDSLLGDIDAAQNERARLSGLLSASLDRAERQRILATVVRTFPELLQDPPRCRKLLHSIGLRIECERGGVSLINLTLS